MISDHKNDNRGEGSRVPRFTFAVLTFLMLSCSCVPPANATVRYEVSLEKRDAHIFQVRMQIPGAVNGMKVAMPTWNALYQIRDFASHVRGVTAVATRSDGTTGASLAVLPLDKQTWEIGNPIEPAAGKSPNEVTVSYTIEWNEPGPFDTQLNEHHAFINLAEILMYIPDRRGEDTTVTFDKLPQEWKLITALSAPKGNRQFSASSYDALVDSPVEAGEFGDFEFGSGGAHFRAAYDSTSGNARRLENYLQQITGYELKLMGGPPFKEYTFLFHIGSYEDVGGGGMEHANSTAISAPSPEAAAAIAAHEFFHAWNVKRIRPQALEPVDYSKEQYTRALWFAEGVTSTYAAYAMERTNLESKDQFYDDLASQITTLESRPSHLWQSAEESSLDTWLDKYDDYNQPDRSISYYNKGQILGVLLDLAIRDATDDHNSLDDVLRRMNDEYAKQGKFYNESEGIRAVVEEIAGKSFADFFRRYVAGADEIPYDDFFSLAGLALTKNEVSTQRPSSSARTTPASVYNYSISEMPNASARQRRIREGILRGTTD